METHSVEKEDSLVETLVEEDSLVKTQEEEASLVGMVEEVVVVMEEDVGDVEAVEDEVTHKKHM